MIGAKRVLVAAFLVLAVVMASEAKAVTFTPNQYYRDLYKQIRTAMGGKSDQFVMMVYTVSAKDCALYLAAKSTNQFPETPQSVRIAAFCDAIRHEVRARGIGGLQA